MKVYNADDIARGCGEDGGAILIAVDGKVYDLTGSKRWPKGRHMNRHQAGRDLTPDLRAAPHGPEVLERFSAVGLYSETPPEAPSSRRAAVNRWLDHHPFWRRHPHPAAAHGPVGIVAPVFLFAFLGLATRSEATEWAAFLCLVLVLLSLPIVMATGYITWWVNYECAHKSTIVWKRRLAWVALVLSAAAVGLRATIADPLEVTSPAVVAYAAAIVALTVIVLIIGYLGGQLTFPYE